MAMAMLHVPFPGHIHHAAGPPWYQSCTVPGHKLFNLNNMQAGVPD